MIVDDSLLQATQLRGILDDKYDVTIAQTAEEGLSRASSEDYSLILLDVVMPGMDGFTLLKKLQEEIATQSIPVILITSLSGVEDEQKGLLLGAVDYITKPFNAVIVRARVSSPCCASCTMPWSSPRRRSPCPRRGVRRCRCRS